MYRPSITSQINQGAKLAITAKIKFFNDKIEIRSTTPGEKGVFTISIRTTEELQEYKLILSQVRTLLRQNEKVYKKCYIENSYEEIFLMSY